MFTGLVQGLGEIVQVTRHGGDVSLGVVPRFEMDGARIGDSVAVDGVCLTVTTLLAGGGFRADVSGESLSRSTLRTVREGRIVNLEQALRLSDRLGGHLVAGHVDGIGIILKKTGQERSWVLRISIVPELARYTIEKGSIAVDGVSLTINRAEGAFLEVNIIPQTGRETTLLGKKAGDAVNLEVDLIAKYVEKLLPGRATSPSAGQGGRITMAKLMEYGFGE